MRHPLFDVLIQLFLSVALVLIALRIGANTTGFGKKFVARLTHACIRYGIIFLLFALALEALSARLR